MTEKRWRVPYPGLRSFRRDETDLFFGREDCVGTMVDRLAAGHFLAVLGSSGTGKSSLVKTGLLDALELGLMDEAGSNWHIIDFTPGSTPITNLARRLIEKSSNVPAEQTASEADSLRAFLQRGPRSIIEWCRAGHLPQGANLLLLADQFEELFRYQGYAGREQAEAFVALLTESARTKEFPIYVVLTMRSEYLGACALIEDLAEMINRSIYLTPRMTREQCREAIVGPAAVCDVEIEPALVNRLLNHIANFAPWDDSSDNSDQLDRLVRRADQLPLLQYTLNRTWLQAREHLQPDADHIKLTLLDYDAIGGLRGALNAHADEIFAELDREKRPVEPIFRALTAGSTVAEAVRRPTRFGDLVALCGGDEAGVRRVVDAFRVSGCNFLMPELDPDHPVAVANDTYIDISHESLIRQWKRLSDWLEKEARAAQEWRRLLDRYATGEPLRGRELAHFVNWREETQPNAVWAKRYGGDYPAVIGFLDRSYREERRKRVLTYASAAAVFVVLAGATIGSTLAYRYAEQQRAESAQQRDEAQRQTAIADAQRLLAESAQKQAETAQQQAEADQKRSQDSYAAAKEALEPLIFELSDALRSVTDMEVATITKVLTSARETIDKLANTNPNDTDLDRYRGILLDNFADTYKSAGDTELARKTNEEALAIFERLAAGADASVDAVHDLAISLWRLAALLDKEEPTRAMELYGRELAADRRLIELEPNDSRWHRRASDALQAMGNLHMRANEFDAALKSFQDMLANDREYLARDEKSIDWQANVAIALQYVGDANAKLKNTNDAAKMYEEMLGIVRGLAEREPGATGWRRDVFISLNKLGGVRMQTSDYEAASKAFDEMLAIARKLHADEPAKLEWHDDVSLALRKLGEARAELDDSVGTIAAYEEGLAVDRELAVREPTVERRSAIASSLKRLGTYRLSQNDVAGASRAFEEMLTINRQLSTANPDDSNAKFDVALALENVADARLKGNDVDGAGKAYQEMLDIVRALAKAEPDVTSWRRDIFISLNKLGGVRLQKNDPNGALKAFDEMLGVARKLHADDASSFEWHEDVSLALVKIGDARTKLSDVQGTIKAYDEALAVDRELADRDPTTARKSAVSSSLYRVGNYRLKNGDAEGARKNYEEMLALDQQLAAIEPAKIQWQADVADSFDRVAQARARTGDTPGARQAYTQAIDQSRKVADQEPDSFRRQNSLGSLLDRVGEFLASLDPAASRQTFQDCFQVLQKVVALTRAQAEDAKSNSELIYQLGRASWIGVLAQQPELAAKLADEALALKADETWIKVNRAHVYLLLGKRDDARALYLRVKDVRRNDGQDTYTTDIRSDFAMMRKLGIATAEIDRMTRELGI